MKEIITDVAIVGFGGSGGTAAIEAHDAGASVLIIEKMEEGGGSTRESGGSLRTAVDPEKAANHFHELTHRTTPIEMMRVFTQGLTEIAEWIESHGGVAQVKQSDHKNNVFPWHSPVSAYPKFKDADGVGVRLRVKGEGEDGGGLSLWKLLFKNVQARKIDVLYDARARRLSKDDTRGVTGVIVSTPEGDVHVRARRAVVLTCGGFNYNTEMQRHFIGTQLPALSPPGRNTGDGIKMAQDVGADLWHMNSVAASFGYKVPGHEAAFCAKIITKRFFIVDQKAKRYANEPTIENHSGFLATGAIDCDEGKYIRIPSYLIFDEDARKAGRIVIESKTSYNQRFAWSSDNNDEVAKGWIKKASTFGELAEQLGLSPSELEATAARFNQGCARGEDEFGRKADLMQPLETRPLYGIPIYPVLLNTQGGPRRNEKSQIIDVFGNPIPRLYSAGEMGSIWGSLYPGAGNVCECIVFGRIAGRNAAGEPPLAD